MWENTCHVYMLVFWVATLASRYQRFGGTQYFHRLGWRWRQYVLPKRWYLPTSSYGVKPQMINTDILTAVRTSNLIHVTSFISHISRPTLRTDYMVWSLGGWPLQLYDPTCNRQSKATHPLHHHRHHPPPTLTSTPKTSSSRSIQNVCTDPAWGGWGPNSLSCTTVDKTKPVHW
jgi:hypothetical protein